MLQRTTRGASASANTNRLRRQMMAATTQDYSQTKTNIEQTGHAILHIAERTNNKAVAEFLSEVLDKLPKDEFYIAVLGLFKRGKSTLINALLGSQVLPTGVIQ